MATTRDITALQETYKHFLLNPTLKEIVILEDGREVTMEDESIQCEGCALQREARCWCVEGKIWKQVTTKNQI